MAIWRFDQGRLDYFAFDEIKVSAAALSKLDGIPKPTATEVDHVRETIAKYSTRPYAPTSYTVWRNYGRVFGAQLLAAEVDGRIRCTNLCQALATSPDDFDADDYLTHIATHFYYPSPAFEGYDPSAAQTFPIVAIVKLLLVRWLQSGKARVSLEEVGSLLIANDVTGTEDLAYFGKLAPDPHNYDLRQVRELMKFISQFSFLKWENPFLYLELAAKEEALAIEAALVPQVGGQVIHSGAEILRLGEIFGPSKLATPEWSGSSAEDVEFTEGRKIRVSHLRTERSGKLKDYFFAHAENPTICDICSLDTPKRFPWAKHVIELHHLLPLASPLKVEAGATSIKDLVGLCPTCHRAIHKYYSGWLRKSELKDFRTYEEAKHVYSEAKHQTVIH